MATCNQDDSTYTFDCQTNSENYTTCTITKLLLSFKWHFVSRMLVPLIFFCIIKNENENEQVNNLEVNFIPVLHQAYAALHRILFTIYKQDLFCKSPSPFHHHTSSISFTILLHHIRVTGYLILFFLLSKMIQVFCIKFIIYFSATFCDVQDVEFEQKLNLKLDPS